MRHCWYRQPPQRLHTKLGDFKSSKRLEFSTIPYHTIPYHICHFWYATALFKPRPSPIAWRSPILSWPRIMLYNRVCYDFFNRRHKCHFIYYSGFSHLVDKSNVLSLKYCVLNNESSVFSPLFQSWLFLASVRCFVSFPCYPYSPNILHVLPSRMAGFHNLWSPLLARTNCAKKCVNSRQNLKMAVHSRFFWC